MTCNELHHITQVFQAMEGTWLLYRKLSLGATMMGTATFHRQGQDLGYHYQEKGSLTLASGKRYTAYHDYGYTYEQNRMMIHTWDIANQKLGSLLHTLCFPVQLTATVWPLCSDSTHQCRRDLYNLTYSFISPVELAFNYVVRGPEKCYDFQTVLLKCG